MRPLFLGWTRFADALQILIVMQAAMPVCEIPPFSA